MATTNKRKLSIDELKSITRKKNVKRAGLVFAYVIIILTISFIAAGGLNPNPNWLDVARKVVITWTMSILLIILAYNDTRLVIEDDQDHILNLSRKSLKTIVKEMTDKGLRFAFSDYSHRVIFLESRNIFFANVLSRVGIDNSNILLLTRNQLDELLVKPLVTTIDGKEVVFDVITPEQDKVISDLKNGEYEYLELPSDYFITANDSSIHDLYRHYAYVKSIRRNNAARRVTIRLMMALVFSVVFALVGEPDDWWSVAFVMLSNLSSGLTGLLAGRGWAKEDALDYARENAYKEQQIEAFFADYNSGVFVPINITDTIKNKLLALDDAYYNDDIDEDDGYTDDDEQQL